MNVKSRRFALAAIAATLSLLGARHVLAQGGITGDNRPLKFVVPFPAGGYTDAVARIVAQHVGSALNQPTIVDNRAGANGVIGTLAVAKSPPDGLTLLVVAPGHASNVSMVSNLPYDTLKDFVSIALLVTLPSVVIVPAASPVSSFKDLLKVARAKPGGLSYGSGGNGSSQHIAMEMLKSRAGISMVHIPYKGSSSAEADLLGGHLDVMFSSTISAIPYAKSGKVKILAISSPQRSSALPDTPTISESGLPGFATLTWVGLFAPAGTAPAMVTRLNGEVNKLMQLPEVQQRIAALGAQSQSNTPQQFDAFVRKEIVEQGAVIKAAHIKAD